jgi:hypothetical protein
MLGFGGIGAIWVLLVATPAATSRDLLLVEAVIRHMIVLGRWADRLTWIHSIQKCEGHRIMRK